MNTDPTLKTYQNGYTTYKQNTVLSFSDLAKEWVDKFLDLLPNNPKVLELGSAFGRDAAYLKSKGALLTCTDIMEKAGKELSRLGFNFEYYNFRDKIHKNWEDKFDGIFANGVLLHAKKDEISSIFKNLSKALSKNGYLACSFKIGIGEEISYQKMEGGRYFSYYTIDSLRTKIPSNFEIVDYFEKENKWLQVILKKI